jgi:hypothetical protein
VQAQHVEGVVEHERDRLRAVPLAPAVFLADRDAELSDAPLVIDVAQVNDTDRPHTRPLVDHELDRVVARIAPDLPFEIRFGLRAAYRPGRIPREQREREVVIPAVVQRAHLAGERPQRHL